MPQRHHILHVSDLHFGKDHGFRLTSAPEIPGEREKELADAVVDDLQHLNVASIDGIVVSGDLMTHGLWKDSKDDVVAGLNRFCQRLTVERNRILIVPGNHDYEWYTDGENPVRKALTPNNAAGVAPGHAVQFNNFLQEFYKNDFHRGPYPKICVVPMSEYCLKIGLLDSCRITPTKFHEYGFLSSGQIKELIALFNQHPYGREVRMISLHHHVTSVLPTEPFQEQPSVSVTLDAGNLLNYSLLAQIGLIVHGHQHYPCVTQVNKLLRTGGTTAFADNGILILSGGSTGVKRERLPLGVGNTYTLISFEGQDVTITIREIYANGEDGRLYFRKRFPLVIRDS
jgi:3',5'-cyclic AMP phosphodiesterase CpdA